MDPGAQDLVFFFFLRLSLISLLLLCTSSLFVLPLFSDRFFFPPHDDKMAASTSQLPSGPLKQVHGKEKSFPLKVPELYLIDSYRTGFTSWASI